MPCVSKSNNDRQHVVPRTLSLSTKYVLPRVITSLNNFYKFNDVRYLVVGEQHPFGIIYTVCITVNNVKVRCR